MFAIEAFGEVSRRDAGSQRTQAKAINKEESTDVADSRRCNSSKSMSRIEDEDGTDNELLWALRSN
jgi:hypothetical protein